jgi:hypothetical protein
MAASGVVGWMGIGTWLQGSLLRRLDRTFTWYPIFDETRPTEWFCVLDRAYFMLRTWAASQHQMGPGHRQRERRALRVGPIGVR